MVKDHLGITFRVRVSGWMVGWMDGWLDGWINRSITKHTLTSIHRSIFTSAGSLQHAESRDSDLSLGQVILGSRRRIFNNDSFRSDWWLWNSPNLRFFPTFFFDPWKENNGKKQLIRPMICMYVHIYICMYAFLPFTFFVFVCKSSYITWGPSCFRQELLRSKRIPQEALYQLKTLWDGCPSLVGEMEGPGPRVGCFFRVGKIAWWDRKYKRCNWCFGNWRVFFTRGGCLPIR